MILYSNYFQLLLFCILFVVLLKRVFLFFCCIITFYTNICSNKKYCIKNQNGENQMIHSHSYIQYLFEDINHLHRTVRKTEPKTSNRKPYRTVKCWIVAALLLNSDLKVNRNSRHQYYFLLPDLLTHGCSCYHRQNATKGLATRHL